MVLKNVICKDHKGPRVGLPIRTAGRSFLELNEAEQQSFSRHRLVVSQPARAGFDKSSPCDAHSRCTSHRSRSPDIALVAPTPAPYLPYRLAITRSPAACTAIAADPLRHLCCASLSAFTAFVRSCYCALSFHILTPHHSILPSHAICYPLIRRPCNLLLPHEISVACQSTLVLRATTHSTFPSPHHELSATVEIERAISVTARAHPALPSLSLKW